MKRLGLLLLALSICACGATTSTAATTSGNTTNGADGSRALLRVRAAPGAHYVTDTRVVTETDGAVVHTRGVGTLDVLRVDERAGSTTFASAIDSMELTDASGNPLAGVAGIDLSGVVFSLAVDPRGTMIGEVTTTGTRPENAAFAEQTRASMSQAFTHLPEDPVGPGDTWVDVMDVALPIAAQNLTMHCELTNRLVAVDDSSGEALAVISVTGACSMPPTPLSDGAMSAEIRSTSSGETRLAIADGIPRRAASRSDMTVRMTDARGATLTEIHMVQDMVTTTTPGGR